MPGEKRPMVDEQQKENKKPVRELRSNRQEQQSVSTLVYCGFSSN